MLTLDGTLYVSGSYKAVCAENFQRSGQIVVADVPRDPRHTANAGLPFVFPRRSCHSAGRVAVNSLSMSMERSANIPNRGSPDLNSWSVLANLSTTAFHTLVSDPDAANFEHAFTGQWCRDTLNQQMLFV